LAHMKIDFLMSGVQPKDYPSPDLPEVALLGRSNSGKSSFINALANKKIAKVSASPGKTRLLNFYSAGEHYRYVDMPGYGFASRSRNEIKSWRKMVEVYMMERSCLTGLLLIMDARRKWTEDEELLREYALGANLPLLVIMTKEDKLGREEKLRQMRPVAEIVGKESVFMVSSLKKTGIAGVEEAIFERWIRNWSSLK
jgi:GTP-binding protein